MVTECPAHRQNRENIFLDNLPITNNKWSVRALLDFTQVPSIRDALDGATNLHLFGEDHNWDSSATESEEDGPERRKKPRLNE